MFQKMIIGMVLVLAAGTFAVAAPPCKDVDVVWTMSSTFGDNVTPTRIYSDGSSYSATIKSCSSGTNDAVLILDRGRTVMFNFAGAFLGTSYSSPPTWTNAGPFASTPSTVKNCGGSPCTVLNIRNILNSGTVDRSQYYILYTRLVSGFVAPDKNRYGVSAQNPATADVAPTPDFPTANSPYLNARVVVEHYPATGTAKEKWLVYPELPTSLGSQSPSPENAGLYSVDHTVNYGEFSMPFYFTIEAQ